MNQLLPKTGEVDPMKALIDSVQGRNPRWLFMNLCAYVDSYGIARVTLKELIRHVRLQRKAINKYMKELIVQGHIEIVKQGKGETPTTYLIKALAAPLAQMAFTVFPGRFPTKHEAVAAGVFYIISTDGRGEPPPRAGKQNILPFPPGKIPPQKIQ